jgi:hypothetical protein
MPVDTEAKPIEFQTIEAWRYQEFLDLGFSETQATLLRDAKDVHGFSVYYGLAKKMLAHGATTDQVVKILS